MKTMKILIVEDDLLLAEDLREQLVDLGYAITDTLSNSHEALTVFRRKLPDLVIMDINLQGSDIDGIQLAEAFNKVDRVPIIFLTAFGDHATVERAKAVRPAYYLIKPCNPTQLQVALDFALDNFAVGEETLALPAPRPIAPCALYSNSSYFFVKDGQKYVRVEIAEVLWVEALGSNVKIVTNDAVVVLAANLASFVSQISNPLLVRVHRSFLVNMRHVTAFSGIGVFIPYKGACHEIPVGRTYREDFTAQLPRLMAD